MGKYLFHIFTEVMLCSPPIFIILSLVLNQAISYVCFKICEDYWCHHKFVNVCIQRKKKKSFVHYKLSRKWYMSAGDGFNCCHDSMSLALDNCVVLWLPPHLLPTNLFSVIRLLLHFVFMNQCVFITRCTSFLSLLSFGKSSFH